MKQHLYSVAIVDDRQLSIDTLARGLGRMADVHISFTAWNGAHLQEQLERHGVPDVILLDVEMPVMNGYRTARWLRSNHPDVRILAVSMFAEPGVILAMLRSGAHGFLPKGVPTNTLYEGIVAVMAHGMLLNEYVTSEMLKAAARPPDGPGVDSLTDRQLELLHYCDSDDTYEAIADKMHLSVHTAKRYGSELYRVFGVHSRAALLHEARKAGLLPVDQGY